MTPEELNNYLNYTRDIPQIDLTQKTDAIQVNPATEDPNASLNPVIKEDKERKEAEAFAPKKKKAINNYRINRLSKGDFSALRLSDEQIWDMMQNQIRQEKFNREMEAKNPVIEQADPVLYTKYGRVQAEEENERAMENLRFAHFYNQWFGPNGNMPWFGNGEVLPETYIDYGATRRAANSVGRRGIELTLAPLAISELPGTAAGDFIGEMAGSMAMGEAADLTSRYFTGKGLGENLRGGIEYVTGYNSDNPFYVVATDMVGNPFYAVIPEKAFYGLKNMVSPINKEYSSLVDRYGIEAANKYMSGKYNPWANGTKNSIDTNQFDILADNTPYSKDEVIVKGPHDSFTPEEAFRFYYGRPLTISTSTTSTTSTKPSVPKITISDFNPEDYKDIGLDDTIRKFHDKLKAEGRNTLTDKEAETLLMTNRLLSRRTNSKVEKVSTKREAEKVMAMLRSKTIMDHIDQAFKDGIINETERDLLKAGPMNITKEADVLYGKYPLDSRDLIDRTFIPDENEARTIGVTYGHGKIKLNGDYYGTDTESMLRNTGWHEVLHSTERGPANIAYANAVKKVNESLKPELTEWAKMGYPSEQSESHYLLKEPEYRERALKTLEYMKKRGLSYDDLYSIVHDDSGILPYDIPKDVNIFMRAYTKDSGRNLVNRVVGTVPIVGAAGLGAASMSESEGYALGGLINRFDRGGFENLPVIYAKPVDPNNQNPGGYADLTTNLDTNATKAYWYDAAGTEPVMASDRKTRLSKGYWVNDDGSLTFESTDSTPWPKAAVRFQDAHGGHYNVHVPMYMLNPNVDTSKPYFDMADISDEYWNSVNKMAASQRVYRNQDMTNNFLNDIMAGGIMVGRNIPGTLNALSYLSAEKTLPAVGRALGAGTFTAESLGGLGAIVDTGMLTAGALHGAGNTYEGIKNGNALQATVGAGEMLLSGLPITKGANNVMRRAVEVGMRSGRGEASASLQIEALKSFYGLKGSLNFTNPSRRITVPAYILTGRKLGRGYNTINPSGRIYTGIWYEDFVPMDGYGDFIDAGLYGTTLDPRIGIPTEDVSIFRDYLDKNYAGRKYHSYVLSSPSDWKEVKPMNLSDMVKTGRNSSIRIGDGLTFDAAGHHIYIDPKTNTTFETDIWKFNPEDYRRSWISYYPKGLNRYLADKAIRIVDRYFDPVITQTPFTIRPSRR